MHLHIVGICGTFMGGLALIARAVGHTVTGCDANVYPPMSTQLREEGITLIEGFDAAQADLPVDIFIIGNVVARGNPLMEAILSRGLPYTSGPQWLGEQVLRGQTSSTQHVLAVAGTHGKTTTSAMLAWMLERAGLQPNFLIGGVAPDLRVSARFQPGGKYFVIEADEYDTAFFDKRSKFVHYRPHTVVLNNLEYDHADIFPDLAAIETQFHHLLRTVPANGCIIRAARSPALDRVLARGCWTPVVTVNATADATPGNGAQDAHAAIWQAQDALPCPDPAPNTADTFEVLRHGQHAGTVRWALSGLHNRANALAALAAAWHVGVEPATAIAALCAFSGVQRRLQLRGTANDVAVFDDFAHHPTAIAATLAALHSRRIYRRMLAVIEPRSNTMKLGSMAAQLPAALAQADLVFCFAPDSGRHALGWQPEKILAPLGNRAASFTQLNALLEAIVAQAQAGDAVLVMSNGGFGGIHDKLLALLKTKTATSATTSATTQTAAQA